LSSPEIDLVTMAGILGRFGSGEISAMAVALREGLPVLMDDRRVREAAAQIGIQILEL
jgi:predicted nucleic acid-binding protein